MKVFYQGAFCEAHVLEKIKCRQEFGPADSRYKFEKLFLEGMVANGAQVEAVCTLPGLRCWPGNQMFFKKQVNDSQYWLCNPTTLNILIIKQVWNAVCVGGLLLKWLWQTKKDKERVFFSYSTDGLTTLVGLLCCKVCGCPTAIFVSEVPAYRAFNGQNSLLRKMLLRCLIFLEMFLHRQFTYYIMSAQAIATLFQVPSNRYIVLEGLISSEADISENSKVPPRREIIYAGGLSQRNNIHSLLAAMEYLHEEDLTLVLYGDGELVPLIQQMALQKSNVIYAGNRPNDEVLQRERAALLLINPRAEEEFTKYSFPSKTIEYLLAGVPTLTSKLAGIPLEYHEYLNFLSDLSAAGIAQSMLSVLNDVQAIPKAKQGKIFVMQKKDKAYQMGRCLSLFKGHH